MFRSNTTENLVVGSASAIAFGFPLLLVLNIPVIGWVNDQPAMYGYTMMALVGYFAVLLGLLAAHGVLAHARRRLGGITGDVLGAMTEIAMTVILVITSL